MTERVDLDYYCPQCGCAEEPGTRCLCGLLWTDDRWTFSHYAVPVDDLDGLRERIARRKTRQALLAPCFNCPTRRALTAMWAMPCCKALPLLPP